MPQPTNGTGFHLVDSLSRNIQEPADLFPRLRILAVQAKALFHDQALARREFTQQFGDGPAQQATVNLDFDMLHGLVSQRKPQVPRR